MLMKKRIMNDLGIGRTTNNDKQRSEPHSREMTNEQHDDIQDDIFEKKKTRGFTYLPHVWAINSNQPGKERWNIQFDMLGNPIDPNKSKYVEFLGTIARNGKLAPLNVKDWHKVPQSLKNAMVDLVKEKFVPCPGLEVTSLKYIGRSWRTFKSRLKVKYFDPNLSAEQNLRKRPTPPDERVLPDHWRYLVYHWSSESVKAISQKNKEIRLMKKMQHITGKRSFPQIIALEKDKTTSNGYMEDNGDENAVGDELDGEISRADLFEKCYTKEGNTSNPIIMETLEKMRLLKNQLAAGEHDKGLHDIYAQVTGVDKGGRLRMYGYQTLVSDVFGNSSSQGRGQRMNTEFEKMKNALEVQGKQIQELQRINKEMSSDHAQLTRVSSASTSRNSVPSRRLISSVDSFSVQGGATVYLKSMFDNTKDVAKGFVESLNPSKVVGHEELGVNWCEVKVNVAIEFLEPLIRSMENVKTIGEAIGHSIAWPKFLIEVDATR